MFIKKKCRNIRGRQAFGVDFHNYEEPKASAQEKKEPKPGKKAAAQKPVVSEQHNEEKENEE